MSVDIHNKAFPSAGSSQGSSWGSQPVCLCSVTKVKVLSDSLTLRFPFPSDLDAGLGGRKGGRADRNWPHGNIVCYRALGQIHTCLGSCKMG